MKLADPRATLVAPRHQSRLRSVIPRNAFGSAIGILNVGSKDSLLCLTDEVAYAKLNRLSSVRTTIR
ncbi:succinate semialdehyde dehydrogenase [Pseudozyma hubeiensis SY62]|uniref:Succinate semialdehyde dehydrogenase n=1 Tax=Pseudozyma hubeiensis (strain SY62) TaxID=1305764 RepID=R9PBY5_PSEHS|nr:succinate semialdehyde dehydrogenase [Pseudozyma hubeiensis SY62]GAC98747.1 succinate semialdehyde dehydrogenase [Pseudozyma hubeiensis SY62]